LFFFAVALAKAIVAMGSNPHLLWDATALQVERALRTVQAFSIAALVLLFLWYSIPFGQNLRGILIGYGLFIAYRVICLNFVSATGHDFWFYAYSTSYLAALNVWLVHLWSYQPSPKPTRGARLETEYQLLAAATHRKLQAFRDLFRKAVRS
jgi:hypothetical protein